MLRMVRCHVCPHDKRTHVTACAAMFSIGVLAVTSCSAGFGPQLGHAIRVRVVAAVTIGAL